MRVVPHPAKPRGTTSPAALTIPSSAQHGKRGGEGRVSALLPLLDDVRHRLRRGASHLPARRSRQNVNLFLREPLAGFSPRVFSSPSSRHCRRFLLPRKKTQKARRMKDRIISRNG